MALELGRVRALMRAALADGAEVKPGHVRWNIARHCERPVGVELSGHVPPLLSDDLRHVKAWNETTPPATLELSVPCRRCPACLGYRSWLWRMRAQAEIEVSARSWFGTLTLAPENHHLMMLRACRARRAKGEDFDAEDPAQQFLLRHREIGKELTKYLKRIRKNSGAPLRFLLVAEAHKSGLPHYHLLLHEVDAFKPVRKVLLQEQWGLGFSHWKLCDDALPARYVAKYLAKSVLARVRASQDYGSAVDVLGHSTLVSPKGGDVKTNVLTDPPKARATF